MTQRKIAIETTIAAPVGHVWRAYTTPAEITQWNFASDDWCCPHAEADLRVGGRYTARMEAKDGSLGFDFEAIYEEVDGGTRVSTVFDAEAQNPVEMQRDGWQAILNNLKAYVERS